MISSILILNFFDLNLSILVQLILHDALRYDQQTVFGGRIGRLKVVANHGWGEICECGMLWRAEREDSLWKSSCPRLYGLILSWLLSERKNLLQILFVQCLEHQTSSTSFKSYQSRKQCEIYSAKRQGARKHHYDYWSVAVTTTIHALYLKIEGQNDRPAQVKE